MVGLGNTIGFVDAQKLGPEGIAKAMFEKLNG